MIKRVVKVIVMSGVLLIPFPHLRVLAQEYKDVDPKVKGVIKKFSTQGVLNEFIGKYGEGYFRPTATVQREDLIMAIYEYDKLTSTLMEYQKVLDKKVRDLSTELDGLKRQTATFRKSGGGSNVDEVMVEVQKNLPVLMSNVPLSPKSEQRIKLLESEITLLKAGGGGGGGGEGSSVDAISRIIRTSPRVKTAIEEEVQDVLSKSPQGKQVGGTGVDMNNVIKEVQKKLPLLIGEVPIPENIRIEFIAIKEKLNLLEQLSEEIGEDMFANILEKSLKVKKVLKEEIKKIDSGK